MSVRILSCECVYEYTCLSPCLDILNIYTSIVQLSIIRVFMKLVDSRRLRIAHGSLRKMEGRDPVLPLVLTFINWRYVQTIDSLCKETWNKVGNKVGG